MGTASEEGFYLQAGKPQKYTDSGRRRSLPNCLLTSRLWGTNLFCLLWTSLISASKANCLGIPPYFRDVDRPLLYLDHSAGDARAVVTGCSRGLVERKKLFLGPALRRRRVPHYCNLPTVSRGIRAFCRMEEKRHSIVGW